MRETGRDTGRERSRLLAGSPGPHPGPKADAQPVTHPAVPVLFSFLSFTTLCLYLFICLPHLATVNSSRTSIIYYSFLQLITEPLTSPVTIQFSITSAQSRHLVNIVESVCNDKTIMFGKLNLKNHYLLTHLIVALSKL